MLGLSKIKNDIVRLQLEIKNLSTTSEQEQYLLSQIADVERHCVQSEVSYNTALSEFGERLRKFDERLAKIEERKTPGRKVKGKNA